MTERNGALIDIMQRNNLIATHFAILLGVKKGHMSDMINGKRRVTEPYIKLIEDHLTTTKVQMNALRNNSQQYVIFKPKPDDTIKRKVLELLARRGHRIDWSKLLSYLHRVLK